MSFIILALASCLASALTLFSGFGLGTLLLPVMALFFPLDWAVAVTALVHFLNNVFKLSLFGKKADKKVVLFFGLPAFLAALAGAFVLNYLTRLPPVTTYVWMGKEHAITYFKLAISGLMIFFAMFEILPMFKNLSFSARWLPLGGVMSGFFGGLSGHQGAFRSAFLIRSGLSREAFIASGVVIACLVNLLDNALRHATHDAGAIQLSLAPLAEDPEALELVVYSAAAAIAPEIERHLFEPFFSTRSRGSGLGLYICRELCERHNGRIEYRRRRTEPEGNEFCVQMRRFHQA
jgi:uncharacterized membrane protein YfcA